MAEKYWMEPEFQAARSDLTAPSLPFAVQRELLETGPQILSDRVPEWYWFDADEQALQVKVHQAYFEIADAGRWGGSKFRSPQTAHPAEQSFFNPVTTTDQPEWTSLVLDWANVFEELDENNLPTVNSTAGLAINELDSIVDAVSRHRFNSGSRTPQLIGALGGNVTGRGIVSIPLREYFTELCEPSGHDEVGHREATAVVKALRTLLLGSPEGIGIGVDVLSDGRFASSIGLVDGTGSLEMTPSYTGNPFYSSHNLDSPLVHLWAFAGLARLVGDAHRYYEEQAAEQKL